MTCFNGQQFAFCGKSVVSLRRNLVQELTLPVYHAWCRMLEWAFWGGKA